MLVLLDDVGFGAGSTFRGAANTPALDAVARKRLKYSGLQTTAICSPTRASLLTGHNPHATGIGAVANSSDARPGNTGIHNPQTASVAKILKNNGYSTAAFGKRHQIAYWQTSQSGPFNR
ncbi:sulfatase-like hydrolase/transferase [Croceicoccus sp. F390]|uniref:Sulfatase-like hydrolase/transferase n=1 Tax=Croceicoccus esteveae TaxID=3075597 RepID=A0ABU2ZEZ7_9SPHN|nr:sulfatase-like hydrolase/transferase [Croceicoccus sp. F390]MDT0574668.1 sulfatase-like hydrolase/transferase [Croceicoccus sp. F390]